MATSISIPLGILGDVAYRKMGNIPMSLHPWTYPISMIPVVGPIATFAILKDDIKS
jgi:hypothetical protein